MDAAISEYATAEWLKHQRTPESLRIQKAKSKMNRGPFQDFRFLHQLSILSYEEKLHQYGVQLWRQEGFDASIPQLPEIRKLLQEYTNALRDYQYVLNLERTKDGEELVDALADQEYPNRYSTTRVIYNDQDPVHGAVRRMIKRLLVKVVGHYGPGPDSFYARKRKRGLYMFVLVQRLARFSVAFLGGLSLVVPIIVLEFLSSDTVRLAIVAIAILLFALLLSHISKVSTHELFATTAGYAAVLAVFLGTLGHGSN